MYRHIETYNGEKYLYYGRYVARFAPGRFLQEEICFIRELSEDKENRVSYFVSNPIYDFTIRKYFRIVAFGYEKKDCTATALRSRALDLGKKSVIIAIIEKLTEYEKAEPAYFHAGFNSNSPDGIDLSYDLVLGGWNDVYHYHYNQ